MLFRRKKPAERGAVVAAGDRARSRGRVRKAIALYRQALEQSPGDPSVHGKLAPLLARRKLREEALASFAAAASGQLKAGFLDRAVSVLKQAVDHYPEEAPLWGELVRLELLRSRTPDAVGALVAGGRRLHRTRHLDVAERLLSRALELEPWHPTAVDLLARTLSRAGRRREALELLDRFGAVAQGVALRRARRLAFRLSPTPANLWRWLRASWRGR